MEEQILAVLARLEEKVDRLDERFDQLEAKLDQGDAKLHRRIDLLEQALIGEFRATDRDRDAILRRVDQLELDVGLLKKAVGR